MLTLKLISEETERVVKGLEKKHFPNAREAVEKVLEYDKIRREAQQKLDNNKQQANQFAKQIGALMKEGKKEEDESAKVTLSPTFSCPMFERSSVSFIAVTVYWSPLMFTTVRQTPLWQTLWSIFSSLVNEHVKVRSTFPPYRFMATMVAISSTIPLNMAFFKY